MLAKSTALIFLLFLLLSSCEIKPLPVEITTDIKGDPLSQLILSNPIEGISDTIDMTLPEPYTLDFGGRSNLLTLVSGRTRSYIYVEPGSKIKISRAEGEREFDITGDFAAEQEFLKDYEKEQGIAMGDFGPNKIMKQGLDSFNISLDQKYRGLVELFDKSKEGGHLSEKFISWIGRRIDASRLQDKVNYPGYYNYFMKSKADIGEDFYGFLDDFDFDNEEQYYFSDVRQAVEAAMAHDINYEDMETPAEYYIAKNNAVAKYISNLNVAEYFRHSALMDKLKYSGGIDGIETQVSDFLENSENDLRKSTMYAELARWAHLKKGLDAPNFTAYTREGEEVKLSDLKGKNVYMDVWATWCGPCISEIPSLKLIEEKYHDENIEFVSVSIDSEKDKQKWMDFVKEKELGGIQVMAEKAWQSEIASFYNISSIPRFIMVDKMGKIVSADAPRPSSDKHFDEMMDEVLD